MTVALLVKSKATREEYHTKIIQRNTIRARITPGP